MKSNLTAGLKDWMRRGRVSSRVEEEVSGKLFSAESLHAFVIRRDTAFETPMLGQSRLHD
jgi:hypothetical protein